MYRGCVHNPIKQCISSTSLAEISLMQPSMKILSASPRFSPLSKGRLPQQHHKSINALRQTKMY